MTTQVSQNNSMKSWSKMNNEERIEYIKAKIATGMSWSWSSSEYAYIKYFKLLNIPTKLSKYI